MLNYLRLNGNFVLDLVDYTTVDGLGHMDVSRVAGLVGIPAPRGQSTPKAEQHGAVNRAKFLNSKVITIEGEAWGVDHANAYGMWDNLTYLLMHALDTDDGMKLTWQRAGGGVEYQSYVKPLGEVEAPLEGAGSRLVYQVQLEQMDPRAYSQTLRHVVGADIAAGGGGLMFPMVPPLDFGESSGGIATVLNYGWINTPPVVRIYGPVTSPRYVLVASGEQVKIVGDIGAGDYLEIDHAKRTVKLNGTTRRMNLLDAPASTFFEVPPGGWDVQLLALNYGAGAHIEVDTRDAYSG